MIGGQTVWGLPKQLAQFTWEMGQNPCVQVHQDDQLLCALDCSWKLPGWQQSLSPPIISKLHSNFMVFEGQAAFKFYLAGIDLHVSPQSPFAALEIEHPLLGFYADPLHLIAGIPQPITQVN